MTAEDRPVSHARLEQGVVPYDPSGSRLPKPVSEVGFTPAFPAVASEFMAALDVLYKPQARGFNITLKPGDPTSVYQEYYDRPLEIEIAGTEKNKASIEMDIKGEAFYQGRFPLEDLQEFAGKAFPGKTLIFISVPTRFRGALQIPGRWGPLPANLYERRKDPKWDPDIADAVRRDLGEHIDQLVPTHDRNFLTVTEAELTELLQPIELEVSLDFYKSWPNEKGKRERARRRVKLDSRPFMYSGFSVIIDDGQKEQGEMAFIVSQYAEDKAFIFLKTFKYDGTPEEVERIIQEMYVLVKKNQRYQEEMERRHLQIPSSED